MNTWRNPRGRKVTFEFRNKRELALLNVVVFELTCLYSIDARAPPFLTNAPVIVVVIVDYSGM